jgi:hypothetical protein
MDVSDLFYPTAALLTARLWFPALRSVLVEIWEIGHPGHGPQEAHRAHGAAGRLSAAAKLSGGFDRKPPRPARDFSTRRRWQAGFGRRGLS